MAGLTNWPKLGVTATATAASFSEVVEGEQSTSSGKKPRPSALVEPTDLTEQMEAESKMQQLQNRGTTIIQSQGPQPL